MYSVMDAHQFRHHDAVTSFDDVMEMEVCMDNDVIKHEPPGVSPHQRGVSPRDAGVSSPPVTMTPALTVGDGDDQACYVSYRLDQDDSGGSSVGSGVQQSIFEADVATAVDLCFSNALRLPYLPSQQRTDASSPSGTAAQHGNGGSGPRQSLGQCKVCGDEATGMYFGALVCVPCKVCRLRITFTYVIGLWAYCGGSVSY